MVDGLKALPQVEPHPLFFSFWSGLLNSLLEFVWVLENAFGVLEALTVELLQCDEAPEIFSVLTFCTPSLVTVLKFHQKFLLIILKMWGDHFTCMVILILPESMVEVVLWWWEPSSSNWLLDVKKSEKGESVKQVYFVINHKSLVGIPLLLKLFNCINKGQHIFTPILYFYFWTR